MPVKTFDYGSGIDEFARAIPAAIQGYQDTEDRKLRRLALEAQLSADEYKKERDEFKEIRDKAKFKRESREFLAREDIPQEVKEAYAQEYGGLLSQGQEEGGMLRPPPIESGRGLVGGDRFRSQSAQRETKAKLLKEEMAGPRQLKKAWNDDPVTKTSKEISAAYGRVQQAASRNSPSGDIALIFNFMKMQDPRSVVREGEFATAQNAGAVDDKVRNLYNRLMTGERLQPGQREDFLETSRGMYESQMQEQDRINQAAIEEAQAYGIDPKKVVSSGLFRARGQKKLKGPGGPPPKQKTGSHPADRYK